MRYFFVAFAVSASAQDLPIQDLKATSCADHRPPSSPQYSCAQQKSWGKCSQSWMVGYCCKTCHDCKGSKCGSPSPSPSTPRRRRSSTPRRRRSSTPRRRRSTPSVPRRRRSGPYYGPVGATHWTSSGNNCHTSFGSSPGKGAAIGLPNGHYGIGEWPSGCGTKHTCSYPKFEYCSNAGTYSEPNCGHHWCVSRYHGSTKRQTTRVTDVCPSNHPDRAHDCCGYSPSVDHCNCVIGYQGHRGVDVSYDAWKYLGGGSNWLVKLTPGECKSFAEMTEEELLELEELKNATIAHMAELGMTAEEYWADTVPPVEFQCEREHQGVACCCHNDATHPDCECAQNSIACPSEMCSLVDQDSWEPLAFNSSSALFVV